MDTPNSSRYLNNDMVYRRRFWALDWFFLEWGGLMKKKSKLEKVALGFCFATLVSLTWFWAVQVGWVIETLQMAYG